MGLRMLARNLSRAWEVFAPAKLNLYLEVLGRRDDGFHELETLMSPIRLFDRLEWHPNLGRDAARFSLRLDPSSAAAIGESLPTDERNLVWRAARLLADAAGIEPRGEILLTKRIPAQAGLGGGSSDAAAALVLCNAAWGISYSRTRLSELAAQLGSDVPFFLAGQTAVCRGRGELVEPVAGTPRLDVVVVCPPEGVPTAAAYRELAAQPLDSALQQESSRRLEALLKNLQSGALTAAGISMTNRLQSAAARLCPWIERLGMAFASIGCCAHLLTGSGSAYFGIMRSARQARRAAGLLSAANLGTVFATSTCR
jgi:4-diphosphocytidyl-2-C-methyl-D-erythritol kinase